MVMVTQKMETQPKIAIVILNYNGEELLKQFLGIVIQKSPDTEIYVFDNGSKDESVIYIQSNYPNINIIRNNNNSGYADGYNQALDNIIADYYILLNSDVQVTDNWIKPIINLMESNHKIAACQPKIKSYKKQDYFEYAGASGGFLDYLGYPFCRGRMFDELEQDNGQYNDAREVFWATGACLFVKANYFHEIGGFDARFFAHMEEIDLCWRLKNQGYSIWVEPKSIVYHLGGGTLESNNSFKTYLNFRNNLFLLYKNLKHPSSIILQRLLLDGLAAIKFLIEGKIKHVFSIIKAHFDFYKEIRKITKEKLNQTHAELYPKSIVLSYYLKRKKKFSELE